MSTDVKSTRVAASGTVFATATRVRSLVVVGAAAAGSLTLRDGGAAGAVRFQVDVPANAFGDIMFPENGLWFHTDVYAEVAGITSANVQYG